MDIRNDWRLAAAAALTFLATAGSAHAVAVALSPAASPVAPETIVSRTPGTTLQVHWNARVRESGGEFILGRVGPGGFVPIIQVDATPGLSAYEAELVARSEGSLHELRFRDRSGREFVLQKVWITRPAPPSFGQGAAYPLGHAQPLAVAAHPSLSVPEGEHRLPAARRIASGGPGREPSTPPPERGEPS